MAINCVFSAIMGVCNTCAVLCVSRGGPGAGGAAAAAASAPHSTRPFATISIRNLTEESSIVVSSYIAVKKKAILRGESSSRGPWNRQILSPLTVAASPARHFEKSSNSIYAKT